jgi:hypothetical protein
VDIVVEQEPTQTQHTQRNGEAAGANKDTEKRKRKKAEEDTLEDDKSDNDNADKDDGDVENEEVNTCHSAAASKKKAKKNNGKRGRPPRYITDGTLASLAEEQRVMLLQLQREKKDLQSKNSHLKDALKEAKRQKERGMQREQQVLFYVLECCYGMRSRY